MSRRLLLQQVCTVAMLTSPSKLRPVREQLQAPTHLESTARRAETGRCHGHFAMQATVRGMRNAFVNLPVENRMRSQLPSWPGADQLRPDLRVHFGRGTVLSISLQRPLQALLVCVVRAWGHRIAACNNKIPLPLLLPPKID